MGNPNAEVIERFYTAFGRCDGEAMAACYHQDIRFSDPVFPDLRGREAGAMWTMLCDRATDLEVVHSAVSADEQTGRAHWDATYTFSATGRQVRNRVDAQFRFRDGQIVEHIDRFDFWAWTRMALGLPGLLLGWTPLIRAAVRKKAKKDLVRFMAQSQNGRS